MLFVLVLSSIATDNRMGCRETLFLCSTLSFLERLPMVLTVPLFITFVPGLLDFFGDRRIVIPGIDSDATVI